MPAERQQARGVVQVANLPQPQPQPLQPLLAGQALLAKHGDSPFWRSVKADAIPLLEGCRFP